MEEEQKRKILSFLSRCRNEESSQTSNIARYLGLESSRGVLSLLRQLESEGLVKKTGDRWQLSRDGGSPSNVPVCGCGGTGDHTEEEDALTPVMPTDNRLPGLTKVNALRRSLPTGRSELTQADSVDDLASKLSSLDLENHHRRCSEPIARTVSCRTEIVLSIEFC